MRASTILYFFVFALWASFCITGGTGCAQIGAPTGGPRDTLPPVLVRSSPDPGSTLFTGNRITLTFNEYIKVEELQDNLLVSPLPKINPLVDFKLKTVTVKLKDSLLPNTTYAIQFGNAIRDNNEGNPLKNFTFVFSTGKTIDSLQQNGKVILAETGLADSTLIAMLYRNAVDSSVEKRKPDYVAKLRKDGSFTFKNLSPGTYSLYALRDVNGSKTYYSRKQEFAFADQKITIPNNEDPVTLYAYAEEKESAKSRIPPPSLKTPPGDRKLKYTAPVSTQNQDLLEDLELDFNKPLKKTDSSKILLTDTNYRAIPSVRLRTDSTRKKLYLSVKWREDTHYRLIIGNTAVSDTSGNTLAKSDTLRFSTKKESDYGSVLLRFSNLDHSRHPVLQIVSGEEIKETAALTGDEWSNKLFRPGEYELRILYDENNNGKWDPGSYSKKRQPEKVVALPQKLSIRANWDNEQDIKL